MLRIALESPVRAVEVLAAEYGPPTASGLVCDTAGLIVARFAHGQTFGQGCGEVGHGR